MDLDALLKVVDDKGKPLYDARTVNDFIALIALAQAPDARARERLARLPPVKRLFSAVAKEIPGKAAPAEKLERYFELHPLPARLLADVQRLSRELVIDPGPPPSEQARRAIGSESARPSAKKKVVAGALKSLGARIAARSPRR